MEYKTNNNEYEDNEITEEEIKEYDNFDNYKTDIVTTIAYLLGIKDYILYGEDSKFNKEVLEKLKSNDNANIIRYLSILRNEFLRNAKEIKNRRLNLISLEQMPDLVSADAIKFLRKNGIEIVHTTLDANGHLAYVNQFILENIDNVKSLIPLWVKWEYIKTLFTMPGCYAGINGSMFSSRDQQKKILLQINKERKIIFDNRSFYPWATYLHWNPKKMMSYYGSVLFNDLKFLKLLYASFGDTFKANDYVIDATEEDKDNIYNFIDKSINIAILVDCENVDPYRFVSVFKGLDEESISKIKKVILYDDIHTSNAWDYINEIVKLPIEHKIIERVLENKSLVDIAMTAGACKEYYQENTESLILASSDSDFWGLIENLPTARYFVLNESNKTSDKILLELQKNNIPFCFMDSFAQSEVQNFKNEVLLKNLKKRIDEFNESGVFEIMDPMELVDTVFDEAFISGSINQIDAEKQSFYNKYIKKGLKISIVEEDGTKRFKMELIGK